MAVNIASGACSVNADAFAHRSMGEVLERAIEEGLRRAFPLDTEEVEKGQRAGMCCSTL